MHMRSLACLALALAACTTTESDDVLTSGIHAVLTATTDGDGSTTVSATLYVGDPIGLDYVQVGGDDRLVARHAGTAKPMIASEFLNTVAHRAVFDTDAEGAQFEVAFERAVDSGAPRSTMALPAPFSASGPASASRTEPVPIVWAPASSQDAMSWEVTGDCVEREASPIDGDTGGIVIPAGAIKKRMGDPVADQCEISVTIRRSKPGTLDPSYGKGGSAAGVQQRTVKLMSTP